MQCDCGGASRVVDSRPRGHGIWRRRRCLECGATWHTFEKRLARVDRRSHPTAADVVDVLCAVQDHGEPE